MDMHIRNYIKNGYITNIIIIVEHLYSGAMCLGRSATEDAEYRTQQQN